jgi:hypothetical protein
VPRKQAFPALSCCEETHVFCTDLFYLGGETRQDLPPRQRIDPPVSTAEEMQVRQLRSRHEPIGGADLKYRKLKEFACNENGSS